MNQELIKPHNSKSATTWGSAGINYEKISNSISDAIENCVNKLAPKKGESILDVATGTGWTARLLANSGAKVTGIDIGEDLINAAKLLADDNHLKIDFQVGDAEGLLFEDNSFDAVISTFGVMFASNPVSSAREISRVCKKSGRLALTTWFPDDTVFGMFKVMKPYMVIPAKPLPSPFEWGNRDRITELFSNDFELEFETGISLMKEPSGKAVWELFLNNYGPTKTLAASLDTQQFENLKRDFIMFHEEYMSDNSIEMPRKYLLTTGVRK